MKINQKSENPIIIALKQLRTLKLFSECVKFGTYLTHFEKYFQNKLNL